MADRKITKAGRSVDPKRLKDLVRLLGGLHKMHEQLLVLIKSKIDAMRRADVPAMQGLSDREQAMAKRLQEREGFRRQLMDAIGADLGLGRGDARALSLSQLTSRLPQEQGASVNKAADTLRKMVARVAQTNRVAGAMSRELVNHLRWVFASVKPEDGRPEGYSGDGDVVVAGDARIFETVG